MPAEDLPAVTIYTDGGADPNPGPGGWGAILIHPASGKTTELSGGEPQSTNNRMELTAAIRALEALGRRSRVRLVTDSQYLRLGVTQWLPGWVARGWRRKAGEVQNIDLWRRLDELARQHEISWDWVKGHSGDRYNERADRLAAAAIRAQRTPRGAAAVPCTEVFLRVTAGGGRGAWAALVRRPGGEEELVRGETDGASANQVDLLAAAEVLERLPAGEAVAFHTGSDYLRHGATRWLPAWRRRGWRTQAGAPVRNRALWERLDAAASTRIVEWPEVKSEEPPELERLGKLLRGKPESEDRGGGTGRARRSGGGEPDTPPDN
ncbi:MAG TPA: ribonuclease HI [Thermoanaerobaculia bacterium]|nr:ribonuclease HI [Thermoanaerobaculia bacterium]